MKNLIMQGRSAIEARHDWGFERTEFLNSSEAGDCIRKIWYGKHTPEAAEEQDWGFARRGSHGESYVTDSLAANNSVALDMIGDKDLNIRAGVRIPRASLRELADDKESGYKVDMEAVEEALSKMSRELLAAADDLDLRSHVGISGGYIVDDHVPLNVSAGIPTIDIIDFDYKPWHTPGDTLEQISPLSLETSGRVTMQLVEKYMLR